LRWLFRTPRHHASDEQARAGRGCARGGWTGGFSPWKPGAMAQSATERRGRREARSEVLSASSAATAPAVLRASSLSCARAGWRRRNKEAESTPSPKRFCRKIGNTEGGLEHVGGVGIAKVVGEHSVGMSPATRLRKMPAQRERRSVASWLVGVWWRKSSQISQASANRKLGAAL